MFELAFAPDGVCIGNREKHTGISMSYAEMASLTMEFIQKMWKHKINTTTYGIVTLQRIKEGDGSPYSLNVIDDKGIPRQIKPSEILEIIINFAE